MGIYTRPDNNAFPSSLITTDIDNAELAARLGSVSVTRRDGRVVFMDDFTSLSSWSVWMSGRVSIRSTFNGGISPLTGDGAVYCEPTADYPYIAGISKTFPILALQTWGLEIAFMTIYTGLPAAPGFFYLEYSVYTGSGTCIQARMRYEGDTGVFSIFSNGAWQELDWLSILAFQNTWINIKLTADFKNSLYKSIKINDQTVDLSGYPLESVAAVVNGIRCILYFDDTNGSQMPGLIDNAIITLEEA